jgi:hypothetical protein
MKDPKKCCICKMKYSIKNLTFFKSSFFNNSFERQICKVCLRKTNIIEYQQLTTDRNTKNYLRHAFKEKDEDFLDLRLLNIKLKRAINERKT